LKGQGGNALPNLVGGGDAGGESAPSKVLICQKSLKIQEK